MYKNGGFPPIKYCSSTNNNIVNPKTSRFFASTINKNINIRQLLADTNIKPIIIPNETSENIDIIESI